MLGLEPRARQFAALVVEMAAVNRPRHVRVLVAQQMRASSASSQSMAARVRVRAISNE
jgi:hypothetical protein